MARREKHRLAERLARAGVVFDEAKGLAGKQEKRRGRLPRNGQEPGALELAVLHGMQQMPHVYQGTVDPVVISERRARNRRARRARRHARLAARA